VKEGYSSWDQPDAYKYSGGANAWSGLSLDDTRGIVFAATGSVSYDWYGGKRLGNNLYANCLLALDAKTGKRLWHYQYIHHDVWTGTFLRRRPSFTIHKDGKKIDAAALTTKTGFVFLFERETGKPIYEIAEMPVPHESI
jgi:quinoprotein glucose dehydrogenase